MGFATSLDTQSIAYNRKPAFVEPSVSVSNLAKNFAGEHALAGVSFVVPRGCLFGMVGADGAGKTTLLRILTTLSDFDKGEAQVLGKDVVGHFLELRKRIGYMPQKFFALSGPHGQGEFDFLR